MKDVSFNEILLKKMQPESPGPVETELKKPSLDLDFETPFLIFSEAKPRTAFVPKKSYKVSPAKPAPVKEVKKTPTSPVEIWILKSSLTIEEQMCWFLFEQMIHEELGEKTSQRQVLSLFRQFAKKTHPDLVKDKSHQHNFADFVKIKNELIAVLVKNQTPS